MRPIANVLVTDVLVAVVFAGGCGEVAPAPVRNDVGDPCRSAKRRCIDEDDVLLCDDGVWTVRVCEEMCAQLDLDLVSRGCQTADGDRHGSEGCVCESADGPQCEPAQQICADGETLLSCSEYSIWESHACANVCADGPIALRSQGCEQDDDEAWCNCTADGEPCSVPGQTRCADAGTLATCIDDRWMLLDCAEACGEAGAGWCMSLPDPPACTC